MTTPTESYDESIREAVARETARRKRVFLAFIGLLLVPIAIGAYALSQAPSEAERVATEATPIVIQRVGGEITSRVTSEVATRTEPIVRDNVSREITTRVEPRIASATSALRVDITALEKTVQETSTVLAAAQPRLASIPEFEGRLTNLAGLVDRTEGAFRTLSAEQNGLREEVAKERELTQGLSNRVEEMKSDSVSSRQLNEFRQAMKRELDSIRAIADTSAQTANSNKEIVGSLARRVSLVETALKELQGRAAAIDDRNDPKRETKGQ